MCSAAKILGVLDANDEISSFERGMSLALERAESEIRERRLDEQTFERLVAEGRHMSLLDGLADVERSLERVD